MNHEEDFVKLFIVHSKRERYLFHLSSQKRRYQFLDRLNHQLDIDMSLAITITSQKTLKDIEQLLQAKGAKGLCHIISDVSAIDGLDLPLPDAVRVVEEHTFGSIISCISGRLAYYKPEAPGERYILEKRN